MDVDFTWQVEWRHFATSLACLNLWPGFLWLPWAMRIGNIGPFVFLVWKVVHDDEDPRDPIKFLVYKPPNSSLAIRWILLIYPSCSFCKILEIMTKFHSRGECWRCSYYDHLMRKVCYWNNFDSWGKYVLLLIFPPLEVFNYRLISSLYFFTCCVFFCSLLLSLFLPLLKFNCVQEENIISIIFSLLFDSRYGMKS